MSFPQRPSLRGSGTCPFLAHIITRLILGGAQENTLLTAERLGARGGPFPTVVLAGAETGSEGSLWEDAALRLVRSEVVPSLVRNVHPARDFLALRWLERRLRAGARGLRTGPAREVYEPFAIVHTHSSKAGILGRQAARRVGVPGIVHTVHGWSFHEGQPASVQALYRFLERRAARTTDRIVCVSERDVVKGLAAGIGGPEQYRVIRSGIELDRFHPDRGARHEVRREFGIPEEAVVVGAVTRLSPQKAPDELAAILLAVLERVPGAWGLVVGDGPNRAEFASRLRERNSGKRVVLTGIRHDAPRFFAALDVFVLPSRWEGLPRTLPQAMATGVPIVCSRIDGNEEAVRNGTEGFVFPAGELEPAVAAVLELVARPELRSRMGQAGRFRAAEFDAERMIEQLARLYEEVLSGAP